MKPRWADAAAATLLVAGCVSFDAAGITVPDVTGTYAATISLTVSNEFETRTDTLRANLSLLNTGDRGRFTGTYAIAANDSGPFEGTMAPDGTLIVGTFGTPPKPIAGVGTVRLLYPWCDWNLLGMPAVRGTLAGDTLRASVAGSVPCLYQLNGTATTAHTDVALALFALRQ
jgi:hypothetical protein